MKIKVNESYHDVLESWTLFDIHKAFKPDADLLIVNGFPVRENCRLSPGDRIVLIRRGETPSAEEFQTLVTARHTPGVHEKVKKGVVGIAGLGGLGSTVAVALARLGIGELILTDYDVVEPSNLNRQQYFTDQIGMSKVEATIRNLKRINPYIRITGYEVRLSPENLPGIMKRARVVVEAFDTPEAKAMLCNTVLSKLPESFVVGVSGLAGYGPSEEIRITRFSGRCFMVGDGATAAGPGVGLMSPRVGVAAHHQASLVLRILLGEEGEK
ncbi:MAG: thiamine biosynthesis protein ThiF [Nitrospirae bacterium CG_4_9_14_3_um_filter_53_35]|nr:MAG: thiamine biosynthesis protein ThiF [Nitrospirae bacterium CG2_30_53_67]PIS37379.1 MAG: thiamine biosynthesis protein ThiF [Nitrospirae bacterium CG08_land_8_20_14_0_20_52_24]PIV82763.1 MAG: thiamine biosynthesis protein ThiF [Nitrospirae bacterium CG17_big_fil_post_rev_8_21_14_2_50_50_9]PIW85396.1 MAG: thiamine biosynthesis protein ThiF [Nitrospirae bacterium CG_4_8_14_3_um_filter_50_41]PIX85330.1 MAG: thiamine biosynthesis protein ThiF [Nitrospirae bacterium CG_4_10_14_3_um_filter_53_4